jgi:hypothetical protein
MLVWPALQPWEDGVHSISPMPQSERICTNSPSASGGLLRGLLARLTSVRLHGTVVTNSATSSGWSCVPAPRRRNRQLPSSVRNVSPNAQSSGLESCRKASAILGAFHASTSGLREGCVLSAPSWNGNDNDQAFLTPGGQD